MLAGAAVIQTTLGHLRCKQMSLPLEEAINALSHNLLGDSIVEKLEFWLIAGGSKCATSVYKHMNHLSMGPSINDVGNWEGGRIADG